MGYVHGLELDSIDALADALQDVDTRRVASLMPNDTQPTAVRRLEDDLLAHFGAEMLAVSENLGLRSGLILEGRLRRLRGKLLIYTITGEEKLDGVFLTAARTFREMVRLVAEKSGTEQATIPGFVSLENDLDASARAKQIRTKNGPLWVNTNLSRSSAESAILTLLHRLSDDEVDVLRAGDRLWGPLIGDI
jgi:hypothetical protein